MAAHWQGKKTASVKTYQAVASGTSLNILHTGVVNNQKIRQSFSLQIHAKTRF